MPESPRSPEPMPGVRVTRIKPRRLCERCCRLIHDFGQANAPYPRAARWRVSTADTIERLCETHKDERLS